MLDRSQRQSLPNSFTRSEELAKFDALAPEWWDPNGKFKHVLAFNHARFAVIERRIAEHFQRELNQQLPLKGLRILDIGCGGGLLTEALARAGAEVIGIDGSEYSIRIAQAHAEQSKVKVEYRHCLAEELGHDQQFDVVLNTEVIEHVEDQQGLIDTCCRLCKPEGLLVLATLNKTLKSFLFGIIGAEYVLRLLPKGTHNWRYFVRPARMQEYLLPHAFHINHVTGLNFNPFSKIWRESNSAQVNYLAFAMHNNGSKEQ
ncbi:bifunctional 2-polyprenyl-6-hydroxyphenol methylase/3-demethylubiquinol 3-O-methyltransferase UbiG [Aliidiomarina celeris]|uniref:bifunctional 2-polyprenyl-6-hydroxyphenol methylase/3-demethylubiquinol 3-O-methyltransferase UbiG n=1 Tax=Aliidiomarina celeris TaxID=2249428 RepID=UPI000DEA2B4D|nr:bifunctional 2-polyprenyl-6-hydroxyphenol methylase/3-demethylubiquinol 3-O-methyltransferase UbiG [Aliidiomarina celeris]